MQFDYFKSKRTLLMLAVLGKFGSEIPMVCGGMYHALSSKSRLLRHVRVKFWLCTYSPCVFAQAAYPSESNFLQF